jgi:hypothetical protein
MLWALVTQVQVLGPTKQQNVAYLVKNTVRFFEIPALWPACSVWHVVFEQVKQLQE